MTNLKITFLLSLQSLLYFCCFSFSEFCINSVKSVFFFICSHSSLSLINLRSINYWTEILLNVLNQQISLFLCTCWSTSSTLCLQLCFSLQFLITQNLRVTQWWHVWPSSMHVWSPRHAYSPMCVSGLLDFQEYLRDI